MVGMVSHFIRQNSSSRSNIPFPPFFLIFCPKKKWHVYLTWLDLHMWQHKKGSIFAHRTSLSLFYCINLHTHVSTTWAVTILHGNSSQWIRKSTNQSKIYLTPPPNLSDQKRPKEERFIKTSYLIQVFLSLCYSS